MLLTRDIREMRRMVTHSTANFLQKLNSTITELPIWCKQTCPLLT